MFVPVAARSILLALCLSAGISAAPTQARSSYAIKDSHHVPRKWSNVGPAPADHILKVNIALKQSQFDELERHLHEVSSPWHERYGNHLSQEEVNELIKPSDKSLDLVHEWLESSGIETAKLTYSPAKDWINVALPVKDVERLLDTKYSVFKHDDGGYVVRAPVWSLPQHLHEHIETITPTNGFFKAKPMATTHKIADLGRPMTPGHSLANNGSVAAVCNVTNVTPTCLRTLYGTIDYTPQVPGLNKVGLTDYLGESNNRSDAAIFLTEYRPEAVPAASSFTVVVINNGTNQQTPNTPAQNAAGTDIEGNLDVQTLIGIDYPTPVVAFTTGGMPPFNPDLNTPTDSNEPYMIWLQYVLSHTDLPQTISTSYGDDEQTVPYSYAKTVCNGFAQLGARGITLLFSSGDNGVGANDTCVSNDGKNTTMFIPAFPASCPYVTTVGATKNFSPEVVAYDPSNGFSSGGGFSNYFPRPHYQRDAVRAYLKALGRDTYKGLFNRHGRAYPDIAAQGQRYAEVYGGKNIHVDGTSAASPCAAGVISLVNDALIAAKKAPLGFMNPFLYATGYEGFTDITSGSTLGCNGAGFPALKGWDPATGFGTPNFKAIKSLAMEC